MHRLSRRSLAALSTAMLAPRVADAQEVPRGATRLREAEAAAAFLGMSARPTAAVPGTAAFELHRDRALFVLHAGGGPSIVGHYYLRFDEIARTAYVEVNAAPHPDGGARLRIFLFRHGQGYLARFLWEGEDRREATVPITLAPLPAETPDAPRLFHREEEIEAAFRDVSILPGDGAPPGLGRYDLHREGWYLLRPASGGPPLLGGYRLATARLCLSDAFAQWPPSLCFNLWRQRDAFLLQRVGRGPMVGSPQPVVLRPLVPIAPGALAQASDDEIRAAFIGRSVSYGRLLQTPRNAHRLLADGSYERIVGFRRDAIRGRYTVRDGSIALRSMAFNGARPEPNLDLRVLKGEGLYYVIEHGSGTGAPSAPRPVALAPLDNRL